MTRWGPNCTLLLLKKFQKFFSWFYPCIYSDFFLLQLLFNIGLKVCRNSFFLFIFYLLEFRYTCFFSPKKKTPLHELQLSRTRELPRSFASNERVCTGTHFALDDSAILRWMILPFCAGWFSHFAQDDFFAARLWAVTRLVISFWQARGSGPNELDHSYEMEEDNIDDDTVDVSPSVQRGSLCEPVGRAESEPFLCFDRFFAIKMISSTGFCSAQRESPPSGCDCALWAELWIQVLNKIQKQNGVNKTYIESISKKWHDLNWLKNIFSSHCFRYGINHVQFFKGSIREAISFAFDRPVPDVRLIFFPSHRRFSIHKQGLGTRS